jgi:hypothetical protein
MSGKSPGPQFSYPAFTFPGPQVKKSYLYVGDVAGTRESQRDMGGVAYWKEPE